MKPPIIVLASSRSGVSAWSFCCIYRQLTPYVCHSVSLSIAKFWCVTLSSRGDVTWRSGMKLFFFNRYGENKFLRAHPKWYFSPHSICNRAIYPVRKKGGCTMFSFPYLTYSTILTISIFFTSTLKGSKFDKCYFLLFSDVLIFTKSL